MNLLNDRTPFRPPSRGALLLSLFTALVLFAGASIPAYSQDLGDPDLTVMNTLRDTYGWGPVFGWPQTNPCPLNGLRNWTGVTCSRARRVVNIVVSCNNVKLNAPIPPILAQLTALTDLQIRGCNLTGPIPAAISTQTQLTRLYLDRNLLTGPIPPAFATSPNLATVNLGNNLLSGAIPLFPQSAYQVLWFHGNFLTSIPAAWTVFNRYISYNCYPTPLPASCSQDGGNCTPNRNDCPSTLTLAKVSGDGQCALAGTLFANPLVVSVVDATNQPVAGVTVSFAGPGISSTTATTDTFGMATATVQASFAVGGNTVTASINPTAAVSFGLTAGSAQTCGASLSVTSANDSGVGTLRQALADVCPGGTISLAPIAGQTIALSPGATGYNFGGRLYIAGDVTILGAGVTVNGGGNTRIFFIQGGTVTLQNLTLAGGLGLGGSSQTGGSAAGMGGAIFQNSGNLTLSGVTLNNNAAIGGAPDQSGSAAGGGFGANFSGGDLGGVTGPGDGAGGAASPVGETGGFGAGGGTASNQGFNAVSSAGGFGGGAGEQNSNGNISHDGKPGYGGSNLGGGAGFGGAIFVRSGSLNLTGVSFVNSSATGGGGAQGKGGALFLYSGVTFNRTASVSFSGSTAPAAGQPGLGNSDAIYAVTATCPGVDTVDICGVVPANTLTVTVAGSGAVTDSTGLINCPSVGCSAMFQNGTVLTAAASPGYFFSGWTGGGCSGTGACTVSLAAGNVGVTANFTAKGNPAIAWDNPAAIRFGSALSSVQLHASANVAGAFVYTPAAGAVLPVGAQLLNVQFTPADPVHYNTASKQVSITVNPGASSGPPVLVTSTVVSRDAGTNAIAIQLTVANSGGATATNFTLQSAKIGSAVLTGPSLPVVLGSVPSGGQQSITLHFPASAGNPGASAVFSITGAYAEGALSSSTRITL